MKKYLNFATQDLHEKYRNNFARHQESIPPQYIKNHAVDW